EALATFITIPFAFLLGAYLWQLLPMRLAVRWAHARFFLMLLALPLGVALAAAVGPAAERWLFAGDIFEWLDGQRGGPTGGWFVLLIPLGALATALLMNRVVNPFIRRRTGHWSARAVAWLDLAKFF